MTSHASDPAPAPAVRGAHTPGPWRARLPHADGLYIVGTDRIQVATVHRRAAPEDARNARLIAAAPDLYEALKAFVRYDTDTEWRLDGEAAANMATGGNVTFLEAIRERAQAALAKAEGR